MSNITTSKTIQALRDIFASYGLPEELVSDNRSTPTSKEFKSFLAENGIRHMLSAPYHPSSNGTAEHMVKTFIFKSSMKAIWNEKGTLNQKLCRWLFSYRTTSHVTTKVTSAELFPGRRLRTRLDFA
jgi:transposase InsO family protein